MKKIGRILGAGLLLALAIFAWWIFSRPERDEAESMSVLGELKGGELVFDEHHSLQVVRFSTRSAMCKST